jgi:hypothetical protein
MSVSYFFGFVLAPREAMEKTFYRKFSGHISRKFSILFCNTLTSTRVNSRRVVKSFPNEKPESGSGRDKM